MFQFRSIIAQKVLEYFLVNPNEAHYINELAHMLELDPGNLYRKLKEFEAEGIFISQVKGSQKYFSLNENYPLLPELKRSFEVKYGLVNQLKIRLDKIKGLSEAYIFGSYANKNFSEVSDIDLLLIGEHDGLAAKGLILPLQKYFGREINIIDIAPEEFRKRKKRQDPFLHNIFSRQNIKLK